MKSGIFTRDFSFFAGTSFATGTRWRLMTTVSPDATHDRMRLKLCCTSYTEAAFTTHIITHISARATQKSLPRQLPQLKPRARARDRCDAPHAARDAGDGRTCGANRGPCLTTRGGPGNRAAFPARRAFPSAK